MTERHIDNNVMYDPVVGKITILSRDFMPVTDEIVYQLQYESPDGQTGGNHTYRLRFEDAERSNLEGANLENWVADRIIADLRENVIGETEVNKMREVTRDDKWNEETNGRIKDAQDGMSDSMDNLEAELISRGPTETELATLAMLMRLYDINMAILSNIDKTTADKIYETHEQGGHFNPPIFIPSVDEDEDDDKN